MNKRVDILGDALGKAWADGRISLAGDASIKELAQELDAALSRARAREMRDYWTSIGRGGIGNE